MGEYRAKALEVLLATLSREKDSLWKLVLPKCENGFIGKISSNKCESISIFKWMVSEFLIMAQNHPSSDYQPSYLATCRLY